jgi:hypothetical protein
LQIIFLFTAAYFSYQVWKYERVAKVWLVVGAALSLMALRRMVVLFKVNLFEDLLLQFTLIDRVFLPFVISLVLVWSFWTLSNHYKRFGVIQIQVERRFGGKQSIGPTKKVTKRVTKKVTKKKKKGKKARNIK